MVTIAPARQQDPNKRKVAEHQANAVAMPQQADPICSGRVNARDKTLTEPKMKRRLVRIDENIARYLSELETANRHGDAVPESKVTPSSVTLTKPSGILAIL